ncbi:MAG TPA: hypothetical protein VH413_14865 [Verrucomicrobiae bacterium]|jgi:hypothetical protein|nr:hypothetical protein [Verrucomicrobiae bacterium]
MGTSRRKIFLFLLLFFFAAALLFECLKAGREPKLTVKFLSITNDTGAWCANFAITNVGGSTAVTAFGFGKIETLGKPGSISVGYRAAVKHLRPGEGEIITAVLPTAMSGRWRFNCYCARNGLRDRIYQWQWGPNGPGARANSFVPRFLKGMRLSVGGTSDWIGP